MRDERGRSARPRRLGELLGDFQEDIKPPTALAAIEMVWRGVVGDQIAEVTELVAEREGVLTVSCSSAVWAQELEMMGPRILSRLSTEIGDLAPQELRFRAGH